VLLCQTIDHLLDIGATLEALHRLVADDGHVFVDVLDVSWVLERQGAIERAVKIDHPYYLTRATALGFFARTGLDVVGERLSDDGHWGFTLRRGTPREPDWTTLQATADALLDRIWSARAGAR
jgi:hypothetical protein